MEPSKLDEAQALLLKLLLCGPDQFTLSDAARLGELLEHEEELPR